MVSDPALQNLVAELAETTPEDMAAVLAMLDPATAARVRNLLAAHFRSESPQPEATAPVNTAGLSDWLAARVAGHPSDDFDTYRMTPHTVETLRGLSASAPRPSVRASRHEVRPAAAEARR